MQMVKLSDSLAVAPQVSAADMPAIAAAGYKVLVNNRPEGEEPGQPPGDELAARAREAGLEYRHMPVTHMDFPGADFAAFGELVSDPERPVLAFCRSGTRCANLWVASRAPDEREQAAATARACGFDLGMATQFIARAGQGQ